MARPFKKWKSKAIGRQYRINLIRKLINRNFSYSKHYKIRIEEIKKAGVFAFSWRDRFRSLFSFNKKIVILYNDSNH